MFSQPWSAWPREEEGRRVILAAVLDMALLSACFREVAVIDWEVAGLLDERIGFKAARCP